MGDPKAVAALFKFIKLWKPELRIFAGDLFDFRPLRGGASEDEKRETMSADYTAGMDFLEQFAPQFMLRGNHDERLWWLRERNNGVASDHAASLILEFEKACKKLNCKILPYHKRHGVLRVGHLKVLHGFNAGIYATRQTALVYGAALMGHTHTVDEHAIPGIERRVARSIGCLCRLDMQYNERQPLSLRHAHGFAYGVLNKKSGDYFVWQAEEIGGQWLLPSDIVTL